MTAVSGGSNTELVEQLLHAFSAGDDAAVLGLVDPAIELVPLVVAAGLVAQPYRGHDGLRAYLGDAEAADVERGFVASRVRAVGDTVVIFGHVHPGGDGATPALWIWRLRGGLVTHGTLISNAGRGANGATRPALSLELPVTAESAGEARHAVRMWADNLTLADREREDIMLAVSEAATNVVRHAYPAGTNHDGFRLHAEVDDGRLLVEVADDGVGLGAVTPDPGLGMGLPLLDALSTAVEFIGMRERERGLEVRMWFAIASLTLEEGP